VKRYDHATQKLLALLVAIIAIGCAPKVVDLTRTDTTLRLAPATPFRASVTIEPFTGNRDAGVRPEDHWEGAMARILREANMFARLLYPKSSSSKVDFTIRADIESHWHTRGFRNFLTYWPGGLLFAPSWRGTRMQFDAEATVELIDAKKDEPVGEYLASTSHEYIHQSGNPFHFLGAALILPGMIRGSTATWPRAKYKKQVYQVAYPQLWKRIAHQIVADRGPVYAAEDRARRERCGEELDGSARVGQSWEEFNSCQSIYYFKGDDADTAEGRASVFVDSAGNRRIYVVDGAITHWQERGGDGRP
jgi:hypothetical protein